MVERLIFDIETVGQQFDSLDDRSKNYMLRFSESEKDAERIKNSLALYPVTGEIVTIAMYSPDQKMSVVYQQAPNGSMERHVEDGTLFVPCTEKEILENFWTAIKKAKQIVTFNGRAFDCPYILTRSGVNKVVPSVDIMPYRYSAEYHVDLMEQLTWYGATGRRFSLEMYCKAFGIDNPKENGDGSDVPNLFTAGEYEKIAKYCLGDVKATAALYDRWNEFMRFTK